MADLQNRHEFELKQLRRRYDDELTDLMNRQEDERKQVDTQNARQNKRKNKAQELEVVDLTSDHEQAAPEKVTNENPNQPEVVGDTCTFSKPPTGSAKPIDLTTPAKKKQRSRKKSIPADAKPEITNQAFHQQLNDRSAILKDAAKIPRDPNLRALKQQQQEGSLGGSFTLKRKEISVTDSEDDSAPTPPSSPLYGKVPKTGREASSKPVKSNKRSRIRPQTQTSRLSAAPAPVAAPQTQTGSPQTPRSRAVGTIPPTPGAPTKKRPSVMNGYRTHAPSSRNGTNAARSGTTKTNLSARFRSVSITPETNKQDNVYGWDKWSKDRAKGDRTLAKEKEKKKQRDENDSDEDTDASMGEPEFEVVNGVLKKKKKD